MAVLGVAWSAGTEAEEAPLAEPGARDAPDAPDAPITWQRPPGERSDGPLTVPIEDWERLADCESGDWSAEGEPEPDSARWDYGLDFDHGDRFQGGLNFHPATWDDYREPEMPAHAGRATRWQEIVIAEQVLEDQGWDAWPVCSEKMDLAE